MTLHLPVTDRLANAHPHLEPHVGKKKVIGHRVVVEGLYWAAPLKRDASGAHGKRRVPYREEFILDAREHRLHDQGALGSLLSEGDLLARLAGKDKEFRALATHDVVEHENLYEDLPVEPELPVEPAQPLSKSKPAKGKK